MKLIDVVDSIRIRYLELYPLLNNEKKSHKISSYIGEKLFLAKFLRNNDIDVVYKFHKYTRQQIIIEQSTKSAADKLFCCSCTEPIKLSFSVQI